MNAQVTSLILYHRRFEWLMRMGESLSAQIHSNFHLILLASREDAIDLLEKAVQFRKAFRGFDCQVNGVYDSKGPNDLSNFAKNIPIETPYVAILCDDDFLLPHFAQSIETQLKDQPDILLYPSLEFHGGGKYLAHRAALQKGFLAPYEVIMKRELFCKSPDLFSSYGLSEEFIDFLLGRRVSVVTDAPGYIADFTPRPKFYPATKLSLKTEPLPLSLLPTAPEVLRPQ